MFNMFTIIWNGMRVLQMKIKIFFITIVVFFAFTVRAEYICTVNAETEDKVYINFSKFHFTGLQTLKLRMNNEDENSPGIMMGMNSHEKNEIFVYYFKDSQFKRSSLIGTLTAVVDKANPFILASAYVPEYGQLSFKCFKNL
jgi:hypothetical protein